MQKVRLTKYERQELQKVRLTKHDRQGLLVLFCVIVSIAILAACRTAKAETWGDRVCKVIGHDAGGNLSYGSGVLVEFKGYQYILSNGHVVAEAVSARGSRSVTLVWPSARIQRAGFVWGYQRKDGIDLAVICTSKEVPMAGIKVVPDVPQQGRANVYGFAQGQQFSFAEVAYRNRGEGNAEFTASPPQGCSGGPLIDPKRGVLISILWGGVAAPGDPWPGLANDTRTVYNYVSWMHNHIHGISQKTAKETQWFGGSCSGNSCQPIRQPRQIIRWNPQSNVMQPARQAAPTRPPRQSGTVPATPARPQLTTKVCKCDEWQKSTEAKLAAMQKELNQLKLEAKGDREAIAAVNNNVSVLAKVQTETVNQLNTLAAKATPDLGEVNKQLDTLHNRLTAEENRRITLEVLQDGQLVGSSTGREIVRLDLQSVNGEN